MFSKNIRRIKSGHDLYVVGQAYRKWLSVIEHKLFTQMLGLNQGRTVKDETWERKQVREKVWSLVIETRIFVDPIAMFGEDNLLMSNPNGSYPLYIYNDHTKTIWDSMYTRFDKNRNSLYSKYTRVVKAAFDAVDEYLKYQPDTLESFHNEDNFTHDGVKVRIVSNDEEDKPENVGAKHKYLIYLSQVLKTIRKMGLGQTAEKPTWILDLAQAKGFTAGEYSKAAGTISSFGLGVSAQVIAHEFGHHVWYTVLNDRQRKAWEDFIEKDMVSFSETDYANIHTALGKAQAAILNSGNSKLASPYSEHLNGVWLNAPHFLTDPATKEMLQGCLNQLEHLHYSFPKGDYESTFARFKKETAKPFMLSVPTEYSNTNPGEAFCEVFSYFVIHHPLTPVIKHQFKMITGLREV